MTTGRGADQTLAAGGPARHIPVLRDAALAALQVTSGKTYLDGTFGAGGYTRAILATPETRVVAIDRDPNAIRDGQALVREMHGRLTLVETRFGDLAQAVAAHDAIPLDGAVFDIGVSSMQLDEAERGFSFRTDGPLDMRMEQSGRSAADLVNEADEETLADILYHYGEERLSRKIARAIVHDRVAKPFTSTKPLADLIGRLVPHKPQDIHPATRTFQALRIAVNDELGELVRGLAAAEQCLKPGGRLVVVTFHSLEDRIVKQFFAARSGRGAAKSRPLPGEPPTVPPTFRCDNALFGKQPIVADAQETARNPRARSAKLRVGERTDAPALGLDPALTALAGLPQRTKRR